MQDSSRCYLLLIYTTNINNKEITNDNKVDLVTIEEIETNLNNLLMDLNSTTTYTNNQAYNQCKKDTTGKWSDYVAVKNNHGTKFVRSKPTKKTKLD